ncbi:helix-turn-helix transcriptional regulator [Sphingomonas sp. 1P06PA]|uniref:helix-turn-helix domain-containing protein n=1 Tax=Sphingomonas sp. 1P06PA TaxID=554121 RepID=UPI0039A72761
MTNYCSALKRYVEADGNSQAGLASAIGTSQPNVHRWANGRLPTREIAEKIAAATGGAVPMELWQSEIVRRFGLGVAA